jgi:O-acetylhomoserine/O-acetylserine sulfhydrylase-like pyridoxal-dependent enzyme
MATLDFSPKKIADESGLSLPLGTYKAAVQKADFAVKSKAGNPTAIVTFVIADGDNKGKTVNKYYNIFSEKANVQNMQKRELGELAKALGLDDAQSRSDENYQGFLTLEVGIRKGKDGKDYENVKYHSVDAEVVTAPAASF